jgi:hypothetical protein
MEFKNGMLILSEPDNIGFPNFKITMFKCDGTNVIINNLTIMRLYAILEKEVTRQGYTMEDYAKEIK